MDIKDAVRSAIAFASESLGPERTADIRLEEIESSTADDRPVWLITLSGALVPKGPLAPGAIRNPFALGADAEREYKVFTVTKDTGEILSMKIRLLATPTSSHFAEFR
jgi:hypothetical protein